MGFNTSIVNQHENMYKLLQLQAVIWSTDLSLKVNFPNAYALKCQIFHLTFYKPFVVSFSPVHKDHP